jgi:RNA polymerase sigma-70 factor (ECF subfamily)
VSHTLPSLAWLDRLFREEHRQLQRRIGRWMGGSAAAEDVLQDTFLRLATSDAAPGAGNLPAYLTRSARHAASDWRRGKPGRPAGEASLSEDFASPLPCPETAAIQRERMRHFATALATLPDRQRQMVVLARVEGLSYAAIAARLGSTPAAVEKAVARALLRLDAALAATAS